VHESFQLVDAGRSRRRVLVSWIGTNDLWGWANAHGAEAVAAVKAALEVEETRSTRDGPIRSLFKAGTHAFDQVHFITNRNFELCDRFSKWFDASVRIHRAELEDVIDYDAVWRETDRIVGDVATAAGGDAELFYFLSPGTSVMTAIFLLLGKTKRPGRFLQVFKDQVREDVIPFDIRADYVSKLFSRSDAYIDGTFESDDVDDSDIIGKSEAIRRARRTAQLVAPRDVNVLLLGESGVGKERFAMYIHEQSSRRSRRLISVNCAAVQESILMAELFGYARGAFTGADKAKKGTFESADGGTIFLDEIGECSLSMQAALLRALQPPEGSDRITRRRFQPVGSSESVDCDVRLVAATNRNLRQEVEAGRFREDLYHRLASIPIRIPPLRERGDDVRLISLRLMEQINEGFERTGSPGYVRRRLSTGAIRFLREQPWPGNIRQLNNTLMRAALLSEHEELHADDLRRSLEECEGPRLRAQHADVTFEEGFTLSGHLQEVSRKVITQARECASREIEERKTTLSQLDRMSQLLGTHRQTLRTKAIKLGVLSSSNAKRRTKRSGK
jgi:DNA-binding NtrC family response regulator